MAGGQIGFTISLVMIALFAFAIIGFTLNFANDNNAVIDLNDDPEISGLYNDKKSSLNTFNTEAESTYESIIETNIKEGSFTAESAGAFAVTPGNVISAVSNILEVGYRKIFGTGAGFGVFIATLLGMIVFVFGLLLWKTLAGRTPD